MWSLINAVIYSHKNSSIKCFYYTCSWFKSGCFGAPMWITVFRFQNKITAFSLNLYAFLSRLIIFFCLSIITFFHFPRFEFVYCYTTDCNGICQEPIAGAVIPPRLKILRIDGEGMINDVIMTTAQDVICEKKNAWKRCCWNCNINLT